MQSAIGKIQLGRMPDWTSARQANSAAIDEVLSEFDVVRCVEVPDHVEHACYKHYAFVNEGVLAEGWSRDRIVNEINALGVPCMPGSCSEVYLEKAFDGTGFRPEARLPVAKELGETSLMFLVHPTLTAAAIEKTCEALRIVLPAATR